MGKRRWADRMRKTIEARLQALEDREAIRELKALYCNLNDGGWAGRSTHEHPQALADLFIEDGEWDGGPVAGRAAGRENIRALFTAFQVVPFVIHNVMNPIIEIDGDRATGHWHAIIMATDPTRQALSIKKNTCAPRQAGDTPASSSNRPSIRPLSLVGQRNNSSTRPVKATING